MSENGLIPSANFVVRAGNTTKIADRKQAEVAFVLEEQPAGKKLLLTEPKARDTLFVS